MNRHSPNYPLQPPSGTHHDELERFAKLKQKNLELTKRLSKMIAERNTWRALADLYKQGKQPSSTDVLEHAKEIENNEPKWISPKDKLPAEGQEVEFVAPYQYVCGNTYRKRFQGHFRKLDNKTDTQIFYAHSIGWGCEFSIDEVECWMPKTPMPEEPYEHNQTKI